MKNLTLGILFLAAVVFGGLWLHQTHQATQAQADAETLRQQAGELQSRLDAQEKRTAALRAQLMETRADAAVKTLEAAQLQNTLHENLTNAAQRAEAATAVATNAKPANALAEMFKNPEMKEMIKNQQKVALGAMIDKNYAGLFSSLRLTPEQSAALKEMILNKQSAAADMGISMLTGELDETNRATMVQQIKAASDAGDAQIKAFLGDANFAQFQSYEQTMTERTVVSSFKDQLGAGPGGLSGDQEQKLIQAMTQERQNFKFTTDFTDKAKLNSDFTAMFTEDQMNTFGDELDRLNQQYLRQAQGILSPDQLTAFEGYLKNQQALQKMGLKMAAKMFAPAKSSGN